MDVLCDFLTCCFCGCCCEEPEALSAEEKSKYGELKPIPGAPKDHVYIGGSVQGTLDEKQKNGYSLAYEVSFYTNS